RSRTASGIEGAGATAITRHLARAQTRAAPRRLQNRTGETGSPGGFQAFEPGSIAIGQARRAHTAPDGRMTSRRWSQHVTTHSNALDLEPGVFTARTARGVAASLKR